MIAQQKSLFSEQVRGQANFELGRSRRPESQSSIEHIIHQTPRSSNDRPLEMHSLEDLQEICAIDCRRQEHGLNDAIAAGLALLEVKRRMGQHDFYDWVQDWTSFSGRAARKYMQLGRHADLIATHRPENLQSALRLITRVVPAMCVTVVLQPTDEAVWQQSSSLIAG